MARIIQLFIVTVAMSLLTACGSGGGAGGSAPAAVNTLTGTYHGSFTGVPNDPNRTWVMTINPDMTVTGYGSNNEAITGTITNGTDFTGNALYGCTLTGKVDLTTGSFSGTWDNPLTDANPDGGFSGSK